MQLQKALECLRILPLYYPYPYPYPYYLNILLKVLHGQRIKHLAHDQPVLLAVLGVYALLLKGVMR